MAGLMCPNCNHYNLAGVPYCQMCGASLSEKDTTLLPPKHSISATPPPKRAPSALVQTSEQTQQPISPKFCPSCGKQVPEGSAFCPHCGSRIPTTITSTVTSPSLATEWEYEDFVYQFPPPGQGMWAKLGSGAYSEAGAKLGSVPVTSR